MLGFISAFGPTPTSILIVGERPGYHESQTGIPFVGPSGRDLERYLRRAGISLSNCRRTNICTDYIDGNPDPTVDEIREQLPTLLDEIVAVSPKWIIAVGRIAARTLTGIDDLSMESAHGMLYPLSEDLSVATGTLYQDSPIPIPSVIVAYHPAYALRSADAAPTVAADYLRAGQYIDGSIVSTTPVDDFDGYEDYIELDDDDFATIIELCNPTLHHWGGIACDTEGFRTDPWLVQLSSTPGSGYIIAKRQHKLLACLDDELQRQNPLVIFQSALHDLAVLRELDIRAPVRFTDTMVLAYLLQTEPQGLKPLARRWAGMRMSSYPDVVRPTQARLSASYFARVVAAMPTQPTWHDRIEEINIVGGVAKIRKPHSLAMRIKRLIADRVKVGTVRSGVRYSHTDTYPEIDYRKRWDALPTNYRDDIAAVLGRPMPTATLMDVPRIRRNRYAARDPDGTLRIFKPLADAVDALDLTRVLDLDLATIPMFERMQANGFEINVAALAELSADMKREMRTAAATVGCNPAPNSKQLTRTLLHDLRLPKPKKLTDKLRLPKVDDDYLEGLETNLAAAVEKPAGRGNEKLQRQLAVVRATMHYRECSKIDSTYATPLQRLVDDNGRLRTNYRITRVVTGRPASVEPNLLNIPTRTELGRRVRDAFVAADGCVYAAADYSGIEMRVMAHLSGDAAMIDVFNSGKDIHTMTAARAFGVDEADVDPHTQRYPAKRMGFLVIFGGGAGKLQSELVKVGIRWSLEDCEKLIDDYTHKLYPGIGRFMTARQTEAKRYGFVREPFSGRIRYLPDAASNDKWKQLAAYREAVNFPIQAGAATIMKRGMAACWRRLPELWDAGVHAEPLLQQYDELIWEVDEDSSEQLRAIVEPSMVSAAELAIPIEISWATGETWATLEK